MISTSVHSQFGDLLKDVAKGSISSELLDKVVKIEQKTDGQGRALPSRLDREGLIQVLENLSPLSEFDGKKKRQIRKDKKKFTLEVLKAIGEGYQQRYAELKYGRDGVITGFQCLKYLDYYQDPGDICIWERGGLDFKSTPVAFPDFNFEAALEKHNTYLQRMKWEIDFLNATGFKETIVMRDSWEVIHPIESKRESAVTFISGKMSSSPIKKIYHSKSPNPRYLVWIKSEMMEGIYNINSDIDFSSRETIVPFSDTYIELINEKFNSMNNESKGGLKKLVDYYSIVREQNHPRRSTYLQKAWEPFGYREDYCEDIFDESVQKEKQRLLDSVNFDLDVCDKENLKFVFRPLFLANPKILQNFTFDALHLAVDDGRDIEREDDVKEQFINETYDILRRVSFEILLYAQHGIKTDFDLNQQIESISNLARSVFYEDIKGNDDIERRVKKHNFDAQDLKTLASFATPNGSRETAIMERFKVFYDPAYEQERNEMSEEEAMLVDLEKLGDLTFNYRMVQNCYEQRKGYEAVYVTRQQWEKSKSLYEKKRTKIIEGSKILSDAFENEPEGAQQLVDQLVDAKYGGGIISALMGTNSAWDPQAVQDCKQFLLGLELNHE